MYERIVPGEIESEESLNGHQENPAAQRSEPARKEPEPAPTDPDAHFQKAYGTRFRSLQDLPRIALLIDGDNVSAKHVKSVIHFLEENYGRVIIRRVYVNFARSAYAWAEDVHLENALVSIHQHDYVKGKNATDFAMVIDAMDILYSKDIDIFCIVTSDSDLTRLVLRLRESDRYTIGIGKDSAPLSLRNCCDEFYEFGDFAHLHSVVEDRPSRPVFTGRVQSRGKPAGFSQKVYKPVQSKNNSLKSSTKPASNTKPAESIRPGAVPLDQISRYIAVILSSAPHRCVRLSTIGTLLSNYVSGFAKENYGCAKLNNLIELLPKFSLTRIDTHYIVYFSHESPPTNWSLLEFNNNILDAAMRSAMGLPPVQSGQPAAPAQQANPAAVQPPAIKKPTALAPVADKPSRPAVPERKKELTPEEREAAKAAVYDYMRLVYASIQRCESFRALDWIVNY